MKRTITIVSISLMFALSLFASANAQSITGVWQVTEEKTTGDGGKTSKVTQPSMYLFTKDHYSVIRVTSDNERPAIDTATATAEQLRDVYVDSFVANAGKYEFKGGKLTIWPSVAKSPTYMKAGSTGTFAVKITGKTMWITSESAQGSPVKNPTTLTLTRVE